MKTDVVPLRPCSKNAKSTLTGSMINVIASLEDTLEIGSGESLLIWQKGNFEHPRLCRSEVQNVPVQIFSLRGMSDENIKEKVDNREKSTTLIMVIKGFWNQTEILKLLS